MVDAVPTPDGDHEYQRELQKHFSRLEEEVKSTYYLANGMMIWNIIEGPSAVYPVRSAWDKLLVKKREYKKHLRTRIIKPGFCIKEEEQIRVSYKKISLNFELVDLVMETMEKQKQEIPLTIMSMAYKGWHRIEVGPDGPSYRKPDIFLFPESLIRWEDIY